MNSFYSDYLVSDKLLMGEWIISYCIKNVRKLFSLVFQMGEGEGRGKGRLYGAWADFLELFSL
jgi:hypothetical protein